jgi:hypothetical protein
LTIYFIWCYRPLRLLRLYFNMLQHNHISKATLNKQSGLSCMRHGILFEIVIPILNHHFQWWTRKSFTDPGRKQRSHGNTKFEYPPVEAQRRSRYRGQRLREHSPYVQASLAMAGRSKYETNMKF